MNQEDYIDSVLAKLAASLNNPRSSTPVARQNEREFSFRPSLTPRSRKIAKRLGSSYKRLTTPRKTKYPLTPFTHTPTLNQRSVQLDARKNNRSQTRWDKLHSLQKHISQKLAKKREDKARADELAERCTFTPDIIGTQVSGKVEERLHEWGKSRDLKHSQLISAEIAKELEKCTFTPVTHQVPCDSGDGVLNRTKGLATFLRRSFRPLTPSKRKTSTQAPRMCLDKYQEVKKKLHLNLLELKP